MRHAALQVGGVAAHDPVAERVEDLALVKALAVAHAVGELHLRLRVLHVDGANQAVGPEHGVRLDKPQLAEHRNGARDRRGVHGEYVGGHVFGQLGIAGGEEQRVAGALHVAQLAVHLRQAVVTWRHVG